MLHPSYLDLINAVNRDVEPGKPPIVQSRYSIVLAASKRARQLIDGEEPMVAIGGLADKPLSLAVREIYEGKVKIIGEGDEEEKKYEEEAGGSLSDYEQPDDPDLSEQLLQDQQPLDD